MRICRPTAITAGNSKATAPTLFIKEEISPEASMMPISNLRGLPPAQCIICWAIKSPTPAWATAPLTMNTPHTLTTAGLANPAKASPASTNPVSTRLTSTIRATTSTRSLSHTKRATAAPKINKTRMLSEVIGLLFGERRMEYLIVRDDGQTARSCGALYHLLSDFPHPQPMTNNI